MLPVPWREKVSSYSKKYSLSEEAALQLYDSDNSKLFEELAPKLKLEPSVVASILVEVPVRLSREGIDEARVTPQALSSVLAAVDAGKFAKEAAALRALTGADARAALVLVAGDDAERVGTVAGLVVERVTSASLGVLGETRAATEEGETR